MSNGHKIRHSKAENASVTEDVTQKAKLEASNALKQTERVREYVFQAIDPERKFRLRPSILLDLNRCAIEGLDAYAGVWRPAGIEIGQSKHEPPDGHMVPELIEELCDYVNDNWGNKTAVHLAAMVMWRINWIHPFTEGNGRTSRASSYLVLCAKTGAHLPGQNTIPQQIVENRDPYYLALEAADKMYGSTKKLSENTVIEMENLLGAMLAAQLADAVREATGETISS